MITDPRRKLGMAPRGSDSPAADASFKDRLRTTTEPTFQVDPENPVMKRRDWRKQKHGDTLTDWDRQPRRHHRHRHTRGIFIGVSAISGLVVLVLAVIFWQRLSRPRAGHVYPVASAGGQSLDLQFEADFRDQVWQTVQAFCAAPSPETFLPLVREPERVGSLVKRFYTPENPWKPLPLASRPDLSDLQVHRNFVVFNLPLTDFGSHPIALEQTSAGFRIDWESFVGYSDLSWAELRRTRPRQPVLLRAVLKPSDYFNLDFPSAATHYCYQISDINSDHVLYGYVLLTSDSALQVQKIMLNNADIKATLDEIAAEVDRASAAYKKG